MIFIYAIQIYYKLVAYKSIQLQGYFVLTALSIPRVKSIMKKTIAKNVAPGRVEIASG